jgi:hypothetical protein
MGPMKTRHQARHFMAQGFDETLALRLGAPTHFGVRPAKVSLHGGHILAQIPDEAQARPPQGHDLSA